jgi:Protein of unknown function (DUF1631)
MASGDITGMGGKAENFELHSSPRARQQKILQACLQLAEQYVEGVLKHVMDKLGDVLHDRGNKGGADADTFTTAAHALGLRRQELSRSLIEGFRQTYKFRLSLAAPASAASKMDNAQSGALSLVDEQDLEESLAIDGLVTKANDRFRNELFALAQRFNQLVEGAQYREETQPLAPDTIAYSFRDVFQSLHWEVEIKLIAYKLFEKNAVQSLGEFYHQLNSQLCDARVLPELKLGAAIRSADGAAQGRSTKSGHGGTLETVTYHNFQGDGMQEGTQRGMTSSVDVYQKLQQLMNDKKYGAASTVGTMEGIPGNGSERSGSDGRSSGGMIAGSSLPADDLVRGLSLLQHNPVAADSANIINVAVIKDALLEQMKQIGDGRGIHPAHDNTIDVIGMIFEFILDEPSIPDVVKNLLNRMQIPIIKVAIVDKAFFTNKTHPARRLLNVLGHASIGWNENSEEARQRRFEKMDYVINRVLEEFEQDPGIFAALLEEFAEFLIKEGGDAGEERIDSVEEQDQSASPDKLIFETIETRLECAEVPEVLRDFLRNTWRNVLQHTLDQNGRDSDRWRRYEQTVDDLMWSVEPKTSADERRKMVMALPRLLDTLREGMTLIQCAKEEIDGAIDALEPIHIACLRGEKSVIEAIEQQQTPKVADAADVSSDAVSDMIRSIQAGITQGEDQIDESTIDVDGGLIEIDSSIGSQGHDPYEVKNIEDEFTAMAADMKLGTWLEFAVDDKTRRGKLAWKSMIMGEYVFVDRKYKVVKEKTLSELAADLRSGRAVLVENVAMFDRALDKVLNGLMSGGAVH